MGIPYLTKHLLPHAESVLLGGPENHRQDEAPRVRSVVIDGPSLVYHVYYQLLACMGPVHDVLDIQPTCNEVSRAVVSWLLQLTRQGIEIHQICFDGALPISKRDTRLARIEKSRHRLELARRRSATSPHEWREEVVFPSTQLWQGRNLPARWRNLPENPFIVSAVYEDLQARWNRKRILQEASHEPSHLPAAEYPWAEITVMVPGEADLECARVSRLKGSAILTNDSDLMVHDLGPHGAVVFLNSVQLIETTQDRAVSEMRGMRLHPHDVARRLGIINIQRFAYELNENPQLGFSELLRRSKEDPGLIEHSDNYQNFLREYQPDPDQPTAIPGPARGPTLDPRVSELFWQYELPDAFCGADQPRIYLGILFEDHSRRCAWEQGRSYRALGYSLLNQSYPTARRFPTVSEFVRRGGRIVAEQITLGGSQSVASDLLILQRRLDLARIVFGDGSLNFWVLFALSEIYHDPSNQTTIPSAAQLERFLTKGFVGKRTEWADIHLLAQIQAVLYSLRMLQQLLHIPQGDELSNPSRFTLDDLPPLHSLLRSRHEILRGFPNGGELVHGLVYQLLKTYD
ncbi:uncharacterized protein N7482_009314 [Penicillium canariense]|uniref:Asteroid domain-containing protein n=1 Tax=Penicillium canariense TaxID=189055 RepID=A0A9W9HR20_9EURO|nr:uncharacterized protein N7482_009314 [Penicillium canariense]KAJ5152836.1 hypothetical protein N7482_009314 [Penicillium canariense]